MKILPIITALIGISTGANAANLSCYIDEGRVFSTISGDWLNIVDDTTMLDIFTSAITYESNIVFEVTSNLTKLLDTQEPFSVFDGNNREMFLKGGINGVEVSRSTVENDRITVYRGICTTQYQ